MSNSLRPPWTVACQTLDIKWYAVNVIFLHVIFILLENVFIPTQWMPKYLGEVCNEICNLHLNDSEKNCRSIDRANITKHCQLLALWGRYIEVHCTILSAFLYVCKFSFLKMLKRICEGCICDKASIVKC